MKKIQSGRSMVEMLGVLAVMGIISIGGLYGYTYAMKRHRANELLNEANKRAVMVASQLMAGKEPENVTVEESNTPYGQFNSNLEDVGDKFKMTVSGLEAGTCELLKSFTGGPLRHVSCKGTGRSFTAEVFFNKDLSTEERASDYTYDNCPNNFYKCKTTNSCVASMDECSDPIVNCSAYPGAVLGNEQAVYEDVIGVASDNITNCYCPQDTHWDGEKCSCEGFVWYSPCGEGCKTCNSETGEWELKPDGSECRINAYLDPPGFGSGLIPEKCRDKFNPLRTCSNGSCI